MNGRQSSSDRWSCLSRRTYLAAAGSAVVGLGSVETATAAQHTLEIQGVGEKSYYSFAVSGSVEPADISSNDEAFRHYGNGSVRNETDVFTFTGELLSFAFKGTVDVDLDDGPAYVGQRPDYVLEIAGTGNAAYYAFDVTDNLEHTEAIGSVNGNDVIDGNHAEGGVGGGTDAYLFDGDLERFSLDGKINVLMNGNAAHVGQRPESDFRGDPSGSSGGDNDGGSDADLELGYNARERSHNQGNTYENFEDFSTGWQPKSGRIESNTPDWEDPADDSAHATLISEGSNDRVEMVNETFSENFAYRDVSMAVRLRGVSNETLRVELAAGDGSEKQVTTRYLSEKHGWVRMTLSPSAWTGTPDMADINEFSISCYTGEKSCEIDVDDIRTTPKRDNGAVLFTFDDANETDYTVAYDELSSRGMSGTSAVIPHLVGNSGKLSTDQLDEIHSNGWAVCLHPQESPGLGSVPASQTREMIEENKRWQLDNGYTRGANTLIWPFGDFDEDAMNIVGEYCDLSFGGGSSSVGGTVTEAAWVPRVELNEDDDAAKAREMIELAYKTETVVVFMTHRMGGSNLSRSTFADLLDQVEYRDLDVLTTADFAAEQ